MVALTTVAMAAAFGAAPPPRPSFNYSWDRISTYAFPGHVLGGNFTTTEVEHFASESVPLISCERD